MELRVTVEEGKDEGFIENGCHVVEDSPPVRLAIGREVRGREKGMVGVCRAGCLRNKEGLYDTPVHTSLLP